MRKILTIPVLFLLGTMLASCATTTAPTESSTKTFDKTTNAALDMTSSTSPGSSGSGSAGIEAFTKANYASIQNDIAGGGGEHLSTLAALLNISPEARSDFYKALQKDYHQLYPEAHTPPLRMLAALDQVLVRSDFAQR